MLRCQTKHVYTRPMHVYLLFSLNSVQGLLMCTSYILFVTGVRVQHSFSGYVTNTKHQWPNNNNQQTLCCCSLSVHSVRAVKIIWNNILNQNSFTVDAFLFFYLCIILFWIDSWIVNVRCCPLLYSYEENSVICGKTGNLYVSVAKFLAGSVLFYAEIIFGEKKSEFPLLQFVCLVSHCSVYFFPPKIISAAHNTLFLLPCSWLGTGM